MMRLFANYSNKLPCAYSIYISFPYNPMYVELVKSTKKRVYDPSTKQWEVDYNCYEDLISKLNASGIAYNADEFVQSINDLIARAQALNAEESSANEEKIDISVLDDVDFKTVPRDYQKEGIVYGLMHDKMLLADTQGLGKSLQCLNIGTIAKVGKHCLIIVGYDALQFNWVQEVNKHTYEKAYVLGQREVKSGKHKGKIRKGTIQERYEDIQNLKDIDAYFIITSITTLRESHQNEVKYTDKNGKIKTKKTYDFYIAKALNDLCQRREIGRIIIDEGQVIKNIESQQTQAALLLTACQHKIIATGTPIMNKHIDLYPLMKWLDQEKTNFYAFRDHYCIMGGYKDKQIIGNKNGDILNKKLQKFMLRRLKEDVLDLPEKIYINEILEMEGKQQVFYDKYRRLVKAELAKCNGNKNIILTGNMKLRQITGHPKIVDEKYKDSVKFERIHQLMYEITENGQKAIIFSNWSTPIDMLYQELKIYNPAKITGATADRMEEVNRFQEDPNCKVILGTIGAMGTGLTLTAASNIIFLDEPWNRALKDQATDRAHRIGTTSNVNVYTLLCKDTVDEKVHRIVQEKGMISDNVIDGMSYEELKEALGFNED